MAVAADSHRNFLIPEETFPPYLALDNGGFISPTTKRVAPLDEARYLFLCIPIVALPSPFVNPPVYPLRKKDIFHVPMRISRPRAHLVKWAVSLSQ